VFFEKLNMNLNSTAGSILASYVVASGKKMVLVCKDIHARYGRIEVCRSIDLAVGSGELVVILGPNGAGKSSFLGALSGLVQGEGTIELDGADIAGKLAHVRAQLGLAFVPETRGNIFPALTVEENLSLGLRAIRTELGSARDRVFDLFPILRERLQAAAGMLSGGEQQMLAIGMAVARQPRVLLLDEPTQGLAPAVQDVLRATIDRLRSEGLALLVAEQNVSFAASIADRFVMLVDGQVAMSGGQTELRRPDLLFSRFLG
jgi:branched-chain amino acid transport system ATP-binding protein